MYNNDEFIEIISLQFRSTSIHRKHSKRLNELYDAMHLANGYYYY